MLLLQWRFHSVKLELDFLIMQANAKHKLNVFVNTKVKLGIHTSKLLCFFL